MRFAAVVVFAVLTSSLAACKSDEPVSGTLSSALVTSSAVVEEIDQSTRRVTLRDAGGKSVTMIAPAEVRNLDQIKVGDEVVVSYHESVAYEVKKPGEATPGVTVVAAARQAEKGDKPGAGAGAAATMTVTIEGIDKDAPSVTLRRPDGRLVVCKVRDREKLERVSVGDLVEITYTEALAVSVEPKK
jgi:Cu/Ag efflux protein CusF